MDLEIAFPKETEITWNFIVISIKKGAVIKKNSFNDFGQYVFGNISGYYLWWKYLL